MVIYQVLTTALSAAAVTLVSLYILVSVKPSRASVRLIKLTTEVFDAHSDRPIPGARIVVLVGRRHIGTYSSDTEGVAEISIRGMGRSYDNVRRISLEIATSGYKTKRVHLVDIINNEQDLGLKPSVPSVRPHYVGGPAT